MLDYMIYVVGYVVGLGWQGKFPFENTAIDGYTGLSPIKSFPPNKYGVYGTYVQNCAIFHSIFRVSYGSFLLRRRRHAG